MDLRYIITPAAQYTDINILVWNLQTGSSPPDCPLDYLEFFSGTSVDPTKTYGRLCAIRNDIDENFVTNKLTVRFYAAYYNTGLSQQAVFSYRAYTSKYLNNIL